MPILINDRMTTIICLTLFTPVQKRKTEVNRYLISILDNRGLKVGEGSMIKPYEYNTDI
jgi:hypothetical protein